MGSGENGMSDFPAKMMNIGLTREGTRMLDRVITVGIFLLSLGLCGLAIHAIFFPGMASLGYGVGVKGEGVPWVIAAGVRDGVLGIVAMTMLLDRRSLSGFLGAMLLVPLADVVIAFQYGTGIQSILPHALGFVGIAVLWVLVYAQASKNRHR
jgi:hypothetical protein